MESEGKHRDLKSRLLSLFWHGGSVYDAWFSCASNQDWFLNFEVAQVLLTLPYSFSLLRMPFGTIFQLFYSLRCVWTAYLICTLYVKYNQKRENNLILGTMSFSGLRFLMGSSGSTGEKRVWPSTTNSFYLDLLSNSACARTNLLTGIVFTSEAPAYYWGR